MIPYYIMVSTIVCFFAGKRGNHHQSRVKIIMAKAFFLSSIIFGKKGTWKGGKDLDHESSGEEETV